MSPGYRRHPTPRWRCLGPIPEAHQARQLGHCSNFNDDPLWLILGTGGYLRETGDFAILVETVPFENYDTLAAPLLDHLSRSWKFTLNNLGPNGLPLIYRADWNECLNLNCFSETPGEPFQATSKGAGRIVESLMIAGLFAHSCGEFARLLDTLGKSADVRGGALPFAFENGRWLLDEDRLGDVAARFRPPHESEVGWIIVRAPVVVASDDVDRALCREGQRRRMPMTRLADTLLRQSLAMPATPATAFPELRAVREEPSFPEPNDAART